MSPVTNPVAQLLALLLGAVFHGIFFTLFVILMLLLSHSVFPSRFHRNLLIPVACAMMFLSTAHLVLSLVRAVQAFVPKDSKHSANPYEYYANFGHPLQTAKSCLFIAQTLLGDAVMMWRCYVVFNKNKIILLLCSLPLIVNLAFGILGSAKFVQHRGDLLDQSGLYLSTYIALTLAVNISCCGAIVYRVWRSSREVQAFRSVFPLVGAIIQSGAIYASGLLALLISYALKSNGVYTILDMIVPLVGIVFSLIVLQIHFHLSCHSRLNANDAEHTSNLPTIGTLPRWRHYFSAPGSAQQQCQSQSGTSSVPNARFQLQHFQAYSREEDIDIDRGSISSTAIKEVTDRGSSGR